MENEEILNNGSLLLTGGSDPSVALGAGMRSSFKCRAKNRAGTALSTTATVLSVLPSDLQAHIETQPATSGGVAYLRCRVTVGVGISNLMTSWYRSGVTGDRDGGNVPMEGEDGLHLLPDAGRFVYGGSGGNNLYVLSVTIQDSEGYYTCRVHHKNTVGRKNYGRSLAFGSSVSLEEGYDLSSQIVGPMSGPAKLVVQRPEADHSPRITSLVPPSIQVVEGEHFTLPCLAEVYPPPHVSWTKKADNGIHRTIGSAHFTYGTISHQSNPWDSPGTERMSGGYTSRTAMGSGLLWVRGPIMGSRRVRAEHEGQYTCLMANSEGKDKATYTLRVLQELRVTAHPKSQIVSAGSRATIRCVIKGQPVAEIRWYKDGLPLLGSRQRNPQQENSLYTQGAQQSASLEDRVLIKGREVVVRGVGGRDAGLYQCVAANAIGETQAGSYLGVKDSPPEFIHTFIEQTLESGPTVSLTCSALGHPPPVITWTHDGKPLMPGHRQTIASYSDIGASYKGASAGPDGISGRNPSDISIRSWVDISGRIVGQISMSSVGPLDGGLYECIASNDVGKVSHMARLNIFGPPIARSPAANITGVSGSELVIPCPIAGYPLTGVTWTLNNRPLTPLTQMSASTLSVDTTGRRALRGDGALVVKAVNESVDVGKYSCSASNAQGRAAVVAFYLDVLRPPMLATITFPKNIVEGMRLSVACSVMSGDLPISLSWSLSGGLSIPKDDSIRENQTPFFNNLIFSNITGKHAGDYTCTGSNAAASTSVTATMRVRVPPHWVVEPEDVWVVAGEDLELDCYAHGTPTPTVSWRRPRIDTGASDSPPVLPDGFRIHLPQPGALRITGTRPEDGGRYLCLAQNGVGSRLSKVIEVAVLEGASIIGGSRDGNVSVGVAGSLALTCSAHGHPPITFTWARDGITIPKMGPQLSTSKSPRISTTHPVGDGPILSTLQVESVNRDHAALYTCQAANAFGTDVKTYVVNVVERPDPPTHVHIINVSSRYIDIAWTAPFDGNSPISHYMIQHWVAESALGLLQSSSGVDAESRKVWADGTQMPYLPLSSDVAAEQELTHSGAETQQRKDLMAGRHVMNTLMNTTVSKDLSNAKIENLTPGTTYHLQVLAVNSLGSSNPSPPMSVSTHQEPPSGPPAMMQATKGGNGEIIVKWQPPPSSPLSSSHVTGYQIGFLVAPKEVSRLYQLTDPSGGSSRNDRKLSRYEMKPSNYNLPPESLRTADENQPSNLEENFTWKWVRDRHLSRNSLTPLGTTLKSLFHFTKYAVSVRAVNEVGPGPMAQPILVTTREVAPSGLPTDVKCSALTSQSLRIRFGPIPENTTNGVILGYKVLYTVMGQLTLGPPAELTKRTSNLETTLSGLFRYSNYSLRVKGYNAAGDGKASEAVYCRTLQDVPGAPASMKTVGSGSDRVAVTWRPPLHPNGRITHYTLSYRPLNAHQVTKSIEVVMPSSPNTIYSSSSDLSSRSLYKQSPERLPTRSGVIMSDLPVSDFDYSEIYQINALTDSYVQQVANLDGHAHFEFWLTASTAVGDSTPTRVMAQAPANNVPAHILSFGGHVFGIRGASLMLPCPVIGSPNPKVTWTPQNPSHKLSIVGNNLHIHRLETHHSRNFTCTARNVHATESISWIVRVVDVPQPAIPHVQHSTESIIQLMWTDPQDTGGMPVIGYVVRYQLVLDSLASANSLPAFDLDWREQEVDALNSNYSLSGLRCGSTYRVVLIAVNVVGRSEESNHITTRTTGNVPQAPQHQDLISTNSSAIHIHLYTWESGGCPVEMYRVSYRRWMDEEHQEGSTEFPASQDTVVLSNLESSQWFWLAISALNAAGESTKVYKVSTRTQSGGLLSPTPIIEVRPDSPTESSLPPFLHPHILAPMLLGGVGTLAIILCVLVAITRSQACSPDDSESKNRQHDSSNGHSEKVLLGSIGSFFSTKGGVSVRDTSREKLSGEKSKHENTYKDESPYEPSPYVSFVDPPSLTTPLTPLTPGDGFGAGAPLDYSLQFQTFGHNDCLGGFIESNSSPRPQMAPPSSSMAPLNPPVGDSLYSSGVILGPTDFSHSRGMVNSVSQDGYKVPNRIRKATSVSFHQMEGAPDLYTERSQPHIMPGVYSLGDQHQYQYPKSNPKPVHRQRAPSISTYAGDSSAEDTLPISRRSHTLGSVYSVDSNLVSPIQPPIGFTDYRNSAEPERRNPGILKPKPNNRGKGRLQNAPAYLCETTRI